MKQCLTLLLIGFTSAANAQTSAGGRGTLVDVEIAAAKNAEKMAALSNESENTSVASAQVLNEMADLLDAMHAAALEGKQPVVLSTLQRLAAKVLQMKAEVKNVADLALQLKIRRAYHTMMNQLGILIVPHWVFVAVSTGPNSNATAVEDIREVSILRNISSVIRPKPFP